MQLTVRVKTSYELVDRIYGAHSLLISVQVKLILVLQSGLKISLTLTLRQRLVGL